jgi:hypothetical protein
VALFQKFVDTSLNDRPSLFRIDSVHQMVTSLSHSVHQYKVYGCNKHTFKMLRSVKWVERVSLRKKEVGRSRGGEQATRGRAGRRPRRAP